jgi:hypothetical protein
MKAIYASLWIFVCLFAVPARGQERGAAQPQNNIVFDVKIVDTEARTAEAMEAIASNQNSLNQNLAEGKAKLVAGTKVHTLLNQRTVMRIGQRVPVQAASLPAFQPSSSNQQNFPPAQSTTGIVQGLALIPQIQYENTGFHLEFEPRLQVDGTIDLLFKIELTILSSESGRLTPTFITRNMSGVIKIKQNQPPMVLEMFQNDFSGQAPAQNSPANPFRGNFFVLLSAKTID